MYCACFVLYSTCGRIELVKSPEVVLCGWLGNKPTINKCLGDWLGKPRGGGQTIRVLAFGQWGGSQQAESLSCSLPELRAEFVPWCSLGLLRTNRSLILNGGHPEMTSAGDWPLKANYLFLTGEGVEYMVWEWDRSAAWLCVVHLNKTYRECLLGGVHVPCTNCMPGGVIKGDLDLLFVRLWYMWCKLFERY